MTRESMLQLQTVLAMLLATRLETEPAIAKLERVKLEMVNVTGHRKLKLLQAHQLAVVVGNGVGEAVETNLAEGEGAARKERRQQKKCARA
mmetsp:Transcript_74531/g.129236  ORF Transcript_74531/g.129236 Transcript_74531/m.129236 type:complete len:91 (+) Transcript_74531:745-1017(+)